MLNWIVRLLDFNQSTTSLRMPRCFGKTAYAVCELQNNA